MTNLKSFLLLFAWVVFVNIHAFASFQSDKNTYSVNLLYNNHHFDPAGADDDGLAEGGESIGLLVSIFNSGTETATNVSASLLCSNSVISITDSQEDYNNIVSDGEQWCLDDFDFDIAADCVEQDVQFVLEITSSQGVWYSPFTVHIFPANPVLIPNLIYNTHAFDPAGEDNDGIAEGGETIGLKVDIFNSGTDTARNISVILRSNDTIVNITDSTENYANIIPDTEGWCLDKFWFDIDPDCQARPVEFVLEITSDEGVWESSFYVQIHPANPVLIPNLIYNTHAFDPAGEDNDGIAEGGETIGLKVDIFNSGTDTARNISVILRSNDTIVNITDSTENYANIIPDTEGWCLDKFWFDIDPDCQARPVEFVLEITSDEGVWESSFYVQIHPANTPLMPNLIYNTHAFDPAGEDDDGLAEGGESIGLNINLYNIGTDTARSLNVVLRCNDTLITITDSTANYVNIIPDSDGWNLDKFWFDIDADCGSQIVAFVVEVTSDEEVWELPFFVQIHPANLVPLPFLIYNTHAFDPAGTDDDGLAEGGETIGLKVNIYNSGLDTARNINAVLRCNDPVIRIIDSISHYDDIIPYRDDWSLVNFSFKIDSIITDQFANFEIQLSSDEGVWTAAFVVQIHPYNYYSVHELASLAGMAYPNPNDGRFKLHAAYFFGKYQYQLLDLSGKRIESGEVIFQNNQDAVMNFNWLNSGVYLLKMTNGKQSGIEKLIIR